MSADLQILAELEEELGVKLRVIKPKLLSTKFLTGYAVDDAERVTVVALPKRKLKALPSSVLRLQHLRVLDLCGNKFTRFPAELGQLRDLQTLDLADNQLSSLPPEIEQLKEPRNSCFVRQSIVQFTA